MVALGLVNALMHLLDKYTVKVPTQHFRIGNLSTFGAIIGTFKQQKIMSLPGFHEIGPKSALELRVHIADRVRLERRREGLTQQEFAERCEIPLRTFKRFEQGQCDSLEIFLRIAITFERTSALELLFPAKPAARVETRSAQALLEKLKSRVSGSY